MTQLNVFEPQPIVYSKEYDCKFYLGYMASYDSQLGIVCYDLCLSETPVPETTEQNGTMRRAFSSLGFSFVRSYIKSGF